METEDGWVTGDAMFVALRLRGLQVGDWVIPTDEALERPFSGYPHDGHVRGQRELIGEPCQLFSVSPPNRFTFIARRQRGGCGVYVDPTVISAWKPGDAP